VKQDPEPAAREALTSFVRRSLVLLIFARQGERTAHHGSGTIVIGGSGRVAVLTAAHVVKPGDLVSLVTTDEFLENVVVEVKQAPNGIDVALAFVEGSTSAVLRKHALGIESIESSAQRIVAPGTLLLTAGFPKQFTYDAHHPSRGSLQHRFADIINYTTDFKHDNRFISIAWKQGALTGQTFPHDDLGVRRGETIQLKKPVGLSGGPVYRVRTTQKDMLWSPTSDATLVGVASEFTNRRELAVPWWHWAHWVTEMLSSP
jgi:hypothetical protein